MTAQPDRSRASGGSQIPKHAGVFRDLPTLSGAGAEMTEEYA